MSALLWQKKSGCRNKRFQFLVVGSSLRVNQGQTRSDNHRPLREKMRLHLLSQARSVTCYSCSSLQVDESALKIPDPN